jgi:hypothetical protein
VDARASEQQVSRLREIIRSTGAKALFFEGLDAALKRRSSTVLRQSSTVPGTSPGGAYGRRIRRLRTVEERPF